MKSIFLDCRAISRKPCGVARVALRYLENFNFEGAEYTILLNEGVSLPLPESVKCVYCPSRYHRLSFKDNIYLFFLLRRSKYDFFFSFHAWLPLSVPARTKTGFLLHDLFAIQSSHFGYRGLIPFLLAKLFTFITWFSVKRSCLVVVPSKYVFDESVARYGCENKFRVIHNGITLITGDQGHESPRRDEFLYVGNFRYYKGFDVLERALILLDSRGISLKVHVVTNESEEAINEKKSSLGRLRHEITFYEKPSDEKLGAIRAGCRWAIIPSRFEGFGLPLLESLMLGLTPIYSNIPVFDEIVGGKQVGRRFSSQSSECLANKIEETINSKLDSDNVGGSEIREFISRNYCWGFKAKDLKNAILGS